MASIATVVTRGYGTFGSINLLPTLGYGSGAAVVLVTGTPHLHRGMVYLSGLQIGDKYAPGVQKGENYLPGVKKGELTDA